MSSAGKHLHDRIPLLGWFRSKLRSVFFRFLMRLSATDEARSLAADTLTGLLERRPREQLALQPSPLDLYPELGTDESSKTAQRDDIVFITGRFRSGSTFLWNLFRHIEGCVSYYEPFNVRRWFDPAERGEEVDPSHLKVSDYWREYEGLERLGCYYSEAWENQNFYMDQDVWAPNMKRFLEIMIEHGCQRPVFQFNRVDFRLPWLRRNFPNAKIVHLFRHPRDQWCSILRDITRCSTAVSISAFARVDGFYLLRWARDLSYQFPFLDDTRIEHPYQLHYLIWRLSYIFGRRYADISVSFERLIEPSSGELERLFQSTGFGDVDRSQLSDLIAAPTLGKWKKYADDAWFKRHERRCEALLAEFFGAS